MRCRSVDAVMHNTWGDPARVLSVRPRQDVPDRCAHGEVLVRVLAAPLHTEDLVRVRAPLHQLNFLQPFCRAENKWEEHALPAFGGGDACGIVMASSKFGDNVNGEDVLPRDWGSKPSDKLAGKSAEDFFSQLDWVVVLPTGRAAPIGSWRQYFVCHEDRLLRVPGGLMSPTHLALHRVLCTGFRLLEDYGQLQANDVVIANAADQPVGLVVLQLCTLLRLRCICVIADTPDFDGIACHLKEQYKAHHILRDCDKIPHEFELIGWPAPRLALDAVGGTSGNRLSTILRPGAPLVVYALHEGVDSVPELGLGLELPLIRTPRSLHGFSLDAWVDKHGPSAYSKMLHAIADLVQAKYLSIEQDIEEVECWEQGSTIPLAHLTSLGQEKKVNTASTFKKVFVLGRCQSIHQEAAKLRSAIAELETRVVWDGCRPMRPPPEVAAYAQGHTKSEAVLENATAAVAQALSKLDLPQYAAMLESSDVEWNLQNEHVLREQLRALGVSKLGHRERVVAALASR